MESLSIIKRNNSDYIHLTDPSNTYTEHIDAEFLDQFAYVAGREKPFENLLE